jgi:hypothetical protein
MATATAPKPPADKIKVKTPIYEVLKTLAAKGEVGKPINVEGITGLPALEKGGYIKVLKRSDKAGRGGNKPILSISLVHPIDAYEEEAVRTRKKRATGTHGAVSSSNVVLTVEALDRFYNDLKAKIKAVEPVVLAEAEKAYQAAYKALPTDAKALTAPENINRVREFNEASANLQEASKLVVQRALSEINAQDYKDLRSPVTELIDLMTTKK